MKKTFALPFKQLAIGGMLLLTGFTIGNTDFFLQIAKNIEIFNKLYREVLINYVDEIDPTQFMRRGIETMLSELDPYTTYLDGSTNEMDLLMSGSYGGVGISVSVRNEQIEITDILSGYSADKSGLKIGDIILSVDSVKVKNLTDLSGKIKGKPGTHLQMEIGRAGQPEPFIIHLIREKIEVKNVTITHELSGKIGYIKLARFNKNAGTEVRRALVELNHQQLNGLILDLRGNPGGRLDEAVDVSSKFLDRRSLIVSTKGRTNDSKKEYYSEDLPLFLHKPMVVLIDSSSASAAEIVAGALQDHDRAVIVGYKSFGKGLVQTIVPIAYDANLKITSARYYTPSGRCIQIRPINNFGIISTDSVIAKTYKTAKGRLVREADGIEPDITLPNDSIPTTLFDLLEKNHISDFVKDYRETFRKMEKENVLNPNEVYELFMNHLKKSNYLGSNDLSQYFVDIDKALEHEKNYTDFRQAIKQAKITLESGIVKELTMHKSILSTFLIRETYRQLFNESRAFSATYSTDPVVTKSLDVLKNTQKILGK